MSKRTVLIMSRRSLPAPGGGSVLGLEQVLLRQRVEQEQRREDEDGGDTEDDEDDGEGGVGGGGLVDAQAGRQQVGELGHRPAPDDGDEGGAGERAQRAPAATHEDGDRGGAAE